MNPTPDDPVPTSDAVDPLDERLSAALDGEPIAGAPGPGDPALDSAAAAARGRALAAARDVLATPPPPLDDVTRRRLLDTARAAGPAPRRDRARWLGPAASVAAVLVAVVLGGWGLIAVLHGSSTSSKSSAAGQGAAAMTTGPLHLRSLGEISNPARLLREVRAELARRPSGDRSSVPGAACRGTVRVPTDVTLEVLARATFHGAPAVVLVGREPPRTLVYVLATGDCRLLSAQFFKG